MAPTYYIILHHISKKENMLERSRSSFFCQDTLAARERYLREAKGGPQEPGCAAAPELGQ